MLVFCNAQHIQGKETEDNMTTWIWCLLDIRIWKPREVDDLIENGKKKREKLRRKRKKKGKKKAYYETLWKLKLLYMFYCDNWFDKVI